MKRAAFVVLVLTFLLALLTGCENPGVSTRGGGVSGQLFYVEESDQIDSEPVPILNRLIRVKGRNITGISNSKGLFVIENIPAGVQTLEFVFHGSETLTKQVDIKAGEITDLGDVFLRYDYYLESPYGSKTLLLFNHENVNLELREIITLAVDKEAMASFYQGETKSANSFIFYPAEGYDDVEPCYNPDLAAQLVEERGLTGKTIRIATNDNPLRGEIINSLKPALESIGLDVQAEIMPWVDILEMYVETHDFDVLIMGGGMTTPLHSMRTVLHSEWELPSRGVDEELQEEIDTLLVAAWNEFDEDKYHSLIAEVDELAREHYVSIPLFVGKVSR